MVIENPSLVEGTGMPARRAAVDAPAYMRNGNDRTPAPSQGVPPADNLDIPTFLRRKMNA
jgi:hypothetical protein